jgi:hypothetical protein
MFTDAFIDVLDSLLAKQLAQGSRCTPPPVLLHVVRCGILHYEHNLDRFRLVWGKFELMFFMRLVLLHHLHQDVLLPLWQPFLLADRVSALFADHCQGSLFLCNDEICLLWTCSYPARGESTRILLAACLICRVLRFNSSKSYTAPSLIAKIPCWNKPSPWTSRWRLDRQG